MQNNLTIDDLVKADHISNAEVRAAAKAYMTGSSDRRFEFASGHVVDLDAAVQASPGTVMALSDPNEMLNEREIMVRRAIGAARPA